MAKNANKNAIKI